MIVDLPSTTTSKISRALVKIREQGGAIALGRVLTLLIETDESNLELAIQAANEASREHPCRIIVVVKPAKEDTARLDGQVRVGGDAGASEVIVLRPFGSSANNPASLVTGLLLPDAPVVAWWPGESPERVSESPLGAISSRRITDAQAAHNPPSKLDELSNNYHPGDTDFAWTRLSLWRAQLAACLDQWTKNLPDRVEIEGDVQNPSFILMVAWLELMLKSDIHVINRPDSIGVKGIYRITLFAGDEYVELLRDKGNIATLRKSNQPDREISLPVRSLRECLAEDLRRLDEDKAFGKVIGTGFQRIRTRLENFHD